ncbi:HNH endonuclease signature motif containing protein [Brevundimonas sp.]|uniref:HNH endonuclease signature motif containing protein n=1 Tax=Brevundimonas sp. TaxID=1871086 RepID=UPI002D469EC2|nr:HNH endonuclease signature motif containing protein [Brevundimonas sp.]HYC66686.1 HNH endonuclease signature motif containing protein [Brevundimonas sp.]
MKGRAIAYSAAEMAWLEANRLLPISDYHRAFVAEFRREVSAQNLHALRKRRGWKTGRTGCFVKGQEPPNKGKPCPPGKGGRHPNAQRTQFKKGARPHTYKGPGHEMIDPKDGYVIMIVAETNPHTGAATRPVHKHRYLWEKAHGPVPDGYCLKCLDGDKANTDPSNWELIPRGVLARLNGGRHKKRLAFDAAHPEIKPVLMTMAKVEHRALELARQRKDAA